MKKWLKDNRGLLVFILCLGLFRTAIADWNPVPTGSMRPTILEGDVVLVNRLAYDLKVPFTDISLAELGDPQRGDIVTFSSPKDGTRLIKRLVALPGDIVTARTGSSSISSPPIFGDQRFVNRSAGPQSMPRAPSRRQLRSVQVAGVRAKSNFGPIAVPAGAYFMMGDNRDNSEDSRYIGSVPRHLLIGRAGRILVSADIKHDWQPRFERTISPLR